MSLYLRILYLSVFIAIIPAHHAAGKELSTVFVLETSDSSSESIVPNTGAGDSPPLTSDAQPKVRSLEDSNTRIVTDDSAPVAISNEAKHTSTSAHTNNQPHNSQPVSTNHSHNTQGQSSEHSSDQHHHLKPNQSHAAHPNTNSQSPSHNSNANSNSHSNHPHQAVPTENQESKQREEARRLDEHTNSSRLKSNTATRSTNQSHQIPTRARTTTASPYEPYTTTPKTEERLLISITSDEDQDEYKPPPKQIGSSGLGQNNDDPRPPQQVHHHQKRKPAITISIQDANLGKQNGGSGPSAVIVRPSENGQSIVISTVSGSSSIDTSGNGNNKYNPIGSNKPAIAIVTSPTNINNDPPYREPINNPANMNSHNSHTSGSTHRPQLVNNNGYNGPSSRPVTSTLIDQSRPNVQVTDERPQRPSAVSDEAGYESQSRPTPRPVVVRPPNEPYGDQQDAGTNGQQQQQDSRYQLNERNCGLVHETKIVGGEEANPDDFLWMAAIVKSKPKDGDVRPFCGGSLITRRHILTAAHCLENLAPRDVLVRLGSYDFDDSTASSLSADYAIDQFRVPAHYSKKTHAADIAIMRLKTPLSLTDNYKTVCMPQPRRSYVGALGTVTGYGSQSQTFRRAAPKLRQVTVPIWENRKCSVVYKKNLTESFLCAGYEEGGKDACQGDSGGPLMTEGPNERMMVVGVVSHGIGCGSPGYPGVYTRTTTYLDWIEKNTKE